MTTQSVVIYTPVQDALYNGGLMFPLIGALVVGAIVFVAIMMVLGPTRLSSQEDRRWADWVMGGSALAAIVAAGLTFHHLAN